MTDDRMQYLVQCATKVLGDHDSAQAWLRQPVSIMDGQIPADVMHTQEGYDRILETLQQMQNGKVT